MNKKMLTKSPSFIGLIVSLVLAIIVPFVLSEWFIGTIIFLLINLILVTSYRLITLVGQWSFMHISLMGTGAYTAGLLVTRLGWSFWFALPPGILMSAIVGLLIGLPLFRTRWFSFFLASYAAGQAIWYTWVIFREPFGGYNGLGFVPRPDPFFGISFVSTLPYYYLVLSATALSLLAIYWLEKSRIGSTLKSIAANEDWCKSIGINIYKYQVVTFAVASAFAGLAGMLYSCYIGTVTPPDFTITYQINVLMMVLIGGTGSFFGPIAGTAFLTIISEVFRGYLEYLPLIYGAVLITVILTLPGGLESIPTQIRLIIKSGQNKR